MSLIQINVPCLIIYSCGKQPCNKRDNVHPSGGYHKIKPLGQNMTLCCTAPHELDSELSWKSELEVLEDE